VSGNGDDEMGTTMEEHTSTNVKHLSAVVNHKGEDGHYQTTGLTPSQRQKLIDQGPQQASPQAKQSNQDKQ